MNLNVNVINLSRKSQCQTFVFRSLRSNLSTSTDLKNEMLQRFGSDLVPDDSDFPIRYTKSGIIKYRLGLHLMFRMYGDSYATVKLCHCGAMDPPDHPAF